MKGTVERQALPPRIYEGGGPRSGRGRLPRGGESLLSHGFAVPAPPEGKPRALRTVLAPRIYEGGGPRSGRGSLSAAAGTALSVTAFRRDRLPADNPVAALTCHLSCHSLPRLRFAYPQKESQGRFVPCAKQQFICIFHPFRTQNEPPFRAARDCQKGQSPFLTKGLQSAARTSCPLTADKMHTCSLSCIFCQVHAPTENNLNLFAACGRQTLRGFFDTLSRPFGRLICGFWGIICTFRAFPWFPPGGTGRCRGRHSGRRPLRMPHSRPRRRDRSACRCGRSPPTCTAQCRRLR